MSDQSNDDKPALTFKDVQAMSRDEINERWDEVQPVLAKGPNAEESDDA